MQRVRRSDIVVCSNAEAAPSGQDVSSADRGSNSEAVEPAVEEAVSEASEAEKIRKQMVLERLNNAKDFADDLASSLAAPDADVTCAHPVVLPTCMHTMQFQGPNRGIGSHAEQTLFAHGLVRDSSGEVMHAPHASLSGGMHGSMSGDHASHSSLLDRVETGHVQSGQSGDQGATKGMSGGVVVANSKRDAVSELSKRLPNSNSNSRSASAMHVPHVRRKGGWHVRRSQLFKDLELGEERKGVLVADAWLIPGFSKLPNIPKEMWPKLLYALDIVCRKLYSEIEVRDRCFP